MWPRCQTRACVSAVSEAPDWDKIRALELELVHFTLIRRGPAPPFAIRTSFIQTDAKESEEWRSAALLSLPCSRCQAVQWSAVSSNPVQMSGWGDVILLLSGQDHCNGQRRLLQRRDGTRTVLSGVCWDNWSAWGQLHTGPTLTAENSGSLAQIKTVAGPQDPWQPRV